MIFFLQCDYGPQTLVDVFIMSVCAPNNDTFVYV